jgi:hypothetical protein
VWLPAGSDQPVVWQLPDALQIQTGDHGAYDVSALWGLYLLDHKGPQVFLHTLTRTLGIDVSQVLLENREVRSFPPLSILVWQSLMNRSTTTFSLPERIDLAWSLRSSGTVQSVQPPEGSLMPVGGQNALGIDVSTFDPWVEQTFPHDDIAKERFLVAIVNATNTKRAGSITGRLLSLLGMTVLSVGDDPMLQSTGSLTASTSQVAQSQTAKVLSRVTGLSVVVDAEKAKEKRADLVVVLGDQAVSRLIP